MSASRRGSNSGISSGVTACLSAAMIAVFSSYGVVAEPVTLQVTSAQVGYDQRSGQPLVVFVLTETAKQAFAKFTSQNVGRAVELRVDGKMMSKPVVREPMFGGSGQIPVSTAEEAMAIASRLLAGTATLEVEVAAP